MSTPHKPSLSDARQTVFLWADMLEKLPRDSTDADASDIELVAALRVVLRAIPDEDDYVAFLRWNGHTYAACDSDAQGAFKVWRLHP